jgi:hypothetical protein
MPMGRIARSWRLLKCSWAVLKQDKELAVLPLVSGACLALLCAGFAFAMDVPAKGVEGREAELGVPAFLLYVVLYTVGFFFQAALIAGASQRLAGGDPTLGSSLAAAGRRFVPILLWGVVAATVGMLLRALEDKAKGLGRIVTGILGAAWSLATFFMVPVLVMERLPVGGSFKRSWALFKQTWGETVVGQFGLGLFGLLGFLSAGMVAAVIYRLAGQTAGVVVGLGLFLFVGVTMSALSGIYQAALYRYATTDEHVPGFDEGLLEGAYAARS